MSIDLASLIVNSIVAFCTVIAIVLTYKGLKTAKKATDVAAASQAQSSRDSIIGRADSLVAASAAVMDAYAVINSSLMPFWKNEDYFGEGDEGWRQMRETVLQAEVDVHRGIHLMGAATNRLALQLDAVRAVDPHAWNSDDYDRLRAWIGAAEETWKPHYFALVGKQTVSTIPEMVKFIDDSLEDAPSSLRSVVAAQVASRLSRDGLRPLSSVTNVVFEGYWQRVQVALTEFLAIAYRMAEGTKGNEPDASLRVLHNERFGTEALSPTRSFVTLPAVETFDTIRDARSAATDQPCVIYRMNNGAIARAESLEGVAQQLIPDMSWNMDKPAERIKLSAARRAASFQLSTLTEWLEEHSLSELPAEALRVLLQPKSAEFNGMVVEPGSMTSWDHPVTLFLVDAYLNGAAPRGNVRLIKATTLEDYLGNFGRLIYDDNKPHAPLAEQRVNGNQD